MRPALGRTQYCLGAVVLILNMTGPLLGLPTKSTSVDNRVSGPNVTPNELHYKVLMSIDLRSNDSCDAGSS